MKKQLHADVTPTSRSVGWGTTGSTLVTPPVAPVIERDEVGCPPNCTHRYRDTSHGDRTIFMCSAGSLPCPHPIAADEIKELRRKGEAALQRAARCVNETCEIAKKVNAGEHRSAFSRPPQCYVCGAEQSLHACAHCGSTICTLHLHEDLCSLCTSAKAMMAGQAERDLNKRNEEVARASEIAANAALNNGVLAGIAACLHRVEARAEGARGVAKDALELVVNELADYWVTVRAGGAIL